MNRRLRLWRLVAALLFCAALWALRSGPDYVAEPPRLSPGLARARLDGGQMLNLAEGGLPNELSRLNMGEQVDFMAARPDLLSRLPGLGAPTINSGRERGYLLEHQSRRARGLITNYEKMDNDESPSTPDNL